MRTLHWIGLIVAHVTYTSNCSVVEAVKVRVLIGNDLAEEPMCRPPRVKIRAFLSSGSAQRLALGRAAWSRDPSRHYVSGGNEQYAAAVARRWRG